MTPGTIGGMQVLAVKRYDILRSDHEEVSVGEVARKVVQYQGIRAHLPDTQWLDAFLRGREEEKATKHLLGSLSSIIIELVILSVHIPFVVNP